MQNALPLSTTHVIFYTIELSFDRGEYQTHCTSLRDVVMAIFHWLHPVAIPDINSCGLTPPRVVSCSAPLSAGPD